MLIATDARAIILIMYTRIFVSAPAYEMIRYELKNFLLGHRALRRALRLRGESPRDAIIKIIEIHRTAGLF